MYDLGCGVNQLTSLDLSNNTALSMLSCHYNQLTCLNVKNGNNVSMGHTYFVAYNNNLSCIEVDDPNWSTQYWLSGNNFWGTNIDPGVTFSTNCNYPAGCF